MSNSTDSPDLKRTDKTPNAIDHVKTGFSATQKILTLIGTILSVIVACITISNATSKKSDTPKSSTAVTTVIKEKEVPKPETNTETKVSTPASSHDSHSTDTPKESSTASSYSEPSSQQSSSFVESSSSETLPSSSVEASQPESSVTESASN